jgi:SAM-dependent methyltransferase
MRDTFPVGIALRDAAKALLPFQPQLRRLKRRVASYADNPSNTEFAITQGLRQIAMLQDAGVDLRGADVLEIGSGWLPVIPLLFHLAGARSLTLTDVERLMDAHTIRLAKQAIAGRATEIAGRLGVDVAAGLAEPFTPHYLVPWLPGQTEAAPVDIVISRAVFEHIPEPALRALLSECRRIVRPDGVMCHTIDNSDHWQHRDRRLSRINMLRYDDDSLLWRIACLNTQAYQNRLRHSDYRQLLWETGWQVVAEDGEIDRNALLDAEKLPVAARFQGKTASDLATITSWFVVRPHSNQVAS